MIDRLQKIDGLLLTTYKTKQVYIHNDHRFLLPLLYDAQERCLIPRPCKFIMFDAHDDLADISEESTNLIKQLREHFNEELFFDLVNNSLYNANWLKAAMELGWVSDVVIFGARNDHTDKDNPFIYTDSSNEKHIIFHSSFHPGELLGFQGSLSDHAKQKELQSFWDVLGWVMTDKGVFAFKDEGEKVMLNFDLDVFSMNYEGYTLPWVQEVYDDRYLKESSYTFTKGWSGKSFALELVKKAGAITIAREPRFCGGVEKMEQIFTDMNRIIFDGGIR